MYLKEDSYPFCIIAVATAVLHHRGVLEKTLHHRSGERVNEQGMKT